MPSHLKILGLLISSIYVNFPEFISIIRGILLQMRRGNRGKVQAFSVSMNSRIAGSENIVVLEIRRIWRLLVMHVCAFKELTSSYPCVTPDRCLRLGPGGERVRLLWALRALQQKENS
jgi:hypothetical protein